MDIFPTSSLTDPREWHKDKHNFIEDVGAVTDSYSVALFLINEDVKNTGKARGRVICPRCLGTMDWREDFTGAISAECQGCPLRFCQSS